MYIDKVTITGVDDSVDRGLLYDLSDRFPFVEWGVLYHPGSEGKPRYPSDDWIEKFDRYAPDFVSRSVHLCGEAATAFCDGDLSVVRDSAYHSPRYGGIQVNIHDGIRRGVNSFSEIADLLIRSNKVVPTIVQLNDITRPIVSALSKKRDGNYVRVLIDSSRGKGISVPIPSEKENVELYNLLKTTRCGFAGGISPNNVMSVAKQIAGISNLHYEVRSILTWEKLIPPSTWIDMESGVRTDNEFDMAKVEAVLVKMQRVMHGIYEE
jgi:hypothetical protein